MYYKRECVCQREGGRERDYYKLGKESFTKKWFRTNLYVLLIINNSDPHNQISPGA